MNIVLERLYKKAVEGKTNDEIVNLTLEYIALKDMHSKIHEEE